MDNFSEGARLQDRSQKSESSRNGKVESRKGVRSQKPVEMGKWKVESIIGKEASSQNPEGKLGFRNKDLGFKSKQT